MTDRSILDDVLREHGVSRAQFFGPVRAPKITKARAEAICRLDEAGYPNGQIASITKLSHATVSYWLRPALREQKKAYYQAYWRKHSGEPARGRSKRNSITEAQRQQLLTLHRQRNFAMIHFLQNEWGLHRRYTSHLAYSRGQYTDLPTLSPLRERIVWSSRLEAGA